MNLTDNVLLSRWPVARHLWRSSGVLVLWGILVVAVAIITLVVSRFNEIDESAWFIAANVTPWYMLGTGVYLTAVYLPLYIAHGVTRRQFMLLATPYMVVLSGVGAALITAGFGIERVGYRLMNWQQELPDDHVGWFSSPDRYGMIFFAYWQLFALFIVTGGFIAAAFYRRAWGGIAGFLLIPVGLIVISPAELAIRNGSPTFVLESFDLDPTIPVAAGAGVACFLVGLAITWAFVRDLPLRSKA